MSAGFVDELIRLVVKYEGSEVRRGKVDVDQLAASLKAADVAGKSLGNTSGKGGNLGMSMLLLSQFMDDAQYGLRGVMNNIPGLAMAFGAGPGLAGALSLATLAGSKLFDQLNTGVRNQVGLVNRDLRPAWQRTWQDISAGFLNMMNPNNPAQAGAFGRITPADLQNAPMLPWMDDEVDRRRKAAEERAKAAVERAAGVAADIGDPNVGKAVRDQIAKSGGGEKLLTEILDATVRKDAAPEVAGRARDNVAAAIARALDGMPDDLVKYLRQAGKGELADKILEAIIPAQQAQAESKAREALTPFMRGLGNALGSMMPGGPQFNAAGAASAFQGGMDAAGVDSAVQQQIGEYFRKNGRAKLRFVPDILAAFSEAGFTEREAYEGMLQVFRLMDSGQPLVTAVQAVLNRATRGGLRQELAQMGASIADQQAAAGAAMLGIGLDGNPNRQSRFAGMGAGQAFGAGADAAPGFRSVGVMEQTAEALAGVAERESEIIRRIDACEAFVGTVLQMLSMNAQSLQRMGRQ